MLFCLVHSTSENIKGNDATTWRFKEVCGALFIKANSKIKKLIYDSVYG
jgi:hypothetical protein